MLLFMEGSTNHWTPSSSTLAFYFDWLQRGSRMHLTFLSVARIIVVELPAFEWKLGPLESTVRFGAGSVVVIH